MKIVCFGPGPLFKGGISNYNTSLVKALHDIPGIEVEVVDPRTLSPLDEETILASVDKTNRLIVIDEANPRCSVARDIAAMVADKGFDTLDAPIKTITAPHTPVPFSPALEDLYLPNASRVLEVVSELIGDESLKAIS